MQTSHGQLSNLVLLFATLRTMTSLLGEAHSLLAFVSYFLTELNYNIMAFFQLVNVNIQHPDVFLEHLLGILLLGLLFISLKGKLKESFSIIALLQ